MTTNKTLQTICAIITAVIIFLMFMYIVAPIVTSLLGFLGKFIGWGPFGSGDSSNPGLIQSMFQGAIITYFSSLLALDYSEKWFSFSNIKIVAVVYGIFSLLYYGAFVAWAYHSEGLLPAAIFCVIALPAPYVAFGAYKNV